MKKIIAIFVLIHLSISLLAGDQPTIKRPIQHAIPEGYILYDIISGDLNKDGNDDLVLMIKATDPEARIVVHDSGQIIDRNRRGLVVLVLDSNFDYTMVTQNPNFLASENEDGGAYFPPDLDLQIAEGKLYLHYAHGRYGYYRYTFRLQDDDMMLIGYDASDNSGPRTNAEESINFLTKKKLTRTNTNKEDEGENPIFEEQWSSIDQKELIRMSDISDIDDFEFYDE